MIDTIKEKLSPIFSTRFIKFCTVGFSGVGVNLGFLFVFASLLNIQTNLASAFAIEISIVSNFVINELWTFKDRHGSRTAIGRAVQFNLVSFVGAIFQWSIFVSLNVVWMLLMFSDSQVIEYQQASNGWLEQWVIHPVMSPPDVGSFMYLSQLLGIGVATFWNFLVNFYWTWAEEKSGE